MKTYPDQILRKARHIRVPAFVPVPLRGRSDGWTAQRQASFLVALARTGSVLAAAREVGMARETAYRLRRRAGAESFAAVWDLVGKGAKAKVTPEQRMLRALGGLVRPVVWRGECAGVVPQVDNSALLGLLAQLDRGTRADREGRKRSQGFEGGFVSSSKPLPGGEGLGWGFVAGNRAEPPIPTLPQRGRALE